MLLCSAALAGCGSASKTLTLNVYNWGEYISDGSEDSFDTIKEFEKWYEQIYKQKLKVNYTTFASNEDMYAKLSSGAVSFDVVIPSDYMIARMRDENMLLELDFKNIPNYRNISESFRGLYYDPDNKYTVPYTYGVIGVIYNANAGTRRTRAAGTSCGTRSTKATSSSSITPATPSAPPSTSWGSMSTALTAPPGTRLSPSSRSRPLWSRAM